jgi:hypothetical protein
VFFEKNGLGPLGVKLVKNGKKIEFSGPATLYYKKNKMFYITIFKCNINFLINKKNCKKKFQEFITILKFQQMHETFMTCSKKYIP